MRGDAAWEISGPARAHGIGVWFDWDGGRAVAFSNSPLSGERHIFGQAFFPWPEPLDLCRGDEVRVQLRSDAVGSEYVYGWETIVRGKDGRTKAAVSAVRLFRTESCHRTDYDRLSGDWLTPAPSEATVSTR